MKSPKEWICKDVEERNNFHLNSHQTQTTNANSGPAVSLISLAEFRVLSIRSANAKCNCKKITHTSKKVHVRLIESLLLLPSFLCTRHSLWSIIVTVSRGIKWTGIDFCFLCPHFAVIRCRLNMLLEIGIGQWAVVCISAALKDIDSWRLQASKGLLKRVILLLSFTVRY